MCVENTAPAFDRAFDQGADGVELDVRIAKSGEVVVFHDATLGRMAKRRGWVHGQPWSELRDVDLGNGARIPLLDEALDIVVARNGIVNVELKGVLDDRRPYLARQELAYKAKLVRAVVRTLGRRSRSDRDRVLFSTFDPLVFAAVRARVREPVAFLFDEEHTQQRRSRWGIRVLRPAVLHPEKAFATESAVRAWKAEGRIVNVWTINDVAAAERLASYGVDGLVSDHIPALRAALHR